MQTSAAKKKRSRAGAWPRKGTAQLRATGEKEKGGEELG